MRTAVVLAVVLSPVALNACGAPCPGGCPATNLSAIVEVTTTSGTALDGVQATLMGPVTETMSCQTYGTSAICSWAALPPVTAGTYSLQVSAVGYQTTTEQVTVTISPPSCGCTAASIQPSTVSLSLPDAG